MLQVEQNPWLGFGAIAIAVLCSGFAGIVLFLYAGHIKRTGELLMFKPEHSMFVNCLC